MRLELAPRTLKDCLAPDLEGGSTAVGPGGGNSVETIRHGEDARTREDFVSLKAARIATAVVALVMHENDFCRAGEKGVVLDEIEANLHMPLHKFSFVLCKRTWLKQNAVRDSELSDVMQIGPSGKTSQ